MEKNCVFWKHWFEKRIYFMRDLLNSEGKFLTLEAFQNKFKIKVNFLHYFKLIAAIPPDLKRKACDSPTLDLLRVPLKYHQLEEKTLVSSKLRCKNY